MSVVTPPEHGSFKELRDKRVTIVTAAPIPQALPIGKGVEDKTEIDIFDVARQVSEALKGLSNKQVQSVLAMVGAQRNLRVSSMDKPIGLSTVTSAVAAKEPEAKKKVKTSSQGPTPKAKFRTSREFHELSEARHQAVESLKRSTDEDKSGMVANLREIEERLKALKAASHLNRLE
jgi:hypothetical protein